jgi:hypothetical protein
MKKEWQKPELICLSVSKETLNYSGVGADLGFYAS